MTRRAWGLAAELASVPQGDDTAHCPGLPSEVRLQVRRRSLLPGDAVALGQPAAQGGRRTEVTRCLVSKFQVTCLHRDAVAAGNAQMPLQAPGGGCGCVSCASLPHGWRHRQGPPVFTQAPAEAASVQVQVPAWMAPCRGQKCNPCLSFSSLSLPRCGGRDFQLLHLRDLSGHLFFSPWEASKSPVRRKGSPRPSAKC